MAESLVRGNALRTERLADGRRRLLRDLTVEIEAEPGSGVGIRVASGFETDFSSIPTPLQCVVRWSRVDIAGVVHDWLYAKGKVTRARADDIWRALARSGRHRAGAWQARLCWLGLRLFGGHAWRRHTRARDAAAVRDEVEQ